MASPAEYPSDKPGFKCQQSLWLHVLEGQWHCLRILIEPQLPGKSSNTTRIESTASASSGMQGWSLKIA